jgi:hypothetical protein
MLYGNQSRRTLHLVGDPHRIDDIPRVNNDLGYSLASWVIARLPDSHWDSGSVLLKWDEIYDRNDIRLVRSLR